MSDALKTAIPLLLIAALAFTLGIWVDRGCTGSRTGQDTTYTHDTLYIPLPPIVTHGEAVLVPDHESRRQLDSVLRVVANKDSLLEALATPTKSEQTFEAKTVTGIKVTGMVAIHHFPLSRVDVAEIRLDPIAVPVRVVHISTVEVKEIWKTEYILGAAAAGIIAGLLIHR